MKILFIVQNAVGQGTYLRAFELARELQQLGNEITILASAPGILNKTRSSNQDGIRIIAVSNLIGGPIQSGWDLYNLWARKWALAGERFDIIHGFETRPTVIYPALSHQRKGALLFLDWADWFGRGGSVEERPNPILRNLLRPVETYYENHFRDQACGTTVICETLKNRARNLGIDEAQLCLLYNGFNLPGWAPITLEEAKAAVNIDKKLSTIGYLGSLFPNDAKLMAKSFNALNARYPETRLMHIGLSNYQVEKYLDDPASLIATGPVDFVTMMTCLSACEILWLPFHNTSANQGRFPLKFSNYLASGRAIVATDVGDIPKFIRKYSVGKVAKDDPQAIFDVVSELLDDPKLRKTYGENALALSKLPSQSWANRAETLLSFYQKRRAPTDE